VPVAAQHAGATELLEDLGGGMAVVVLADPDQRHLRVDGFEEAGGVRGRAVVGDLQHVRAQAGGVAQESALRRFLGVAGEQDSAVAVADP
jgi:hypothetical protein